MDEATQELFTEDRGTIHDAPHHSVFCGIREAYNRYGSCATGSVEPRTARVPQKVAILTRGIAIAVEIDNSPPQCAIHIVVF